MNWQETPKHHGKIHLATTPAWAAFLVRGISAGWPFVVTSLNKLKNCGHLVGSEFFVVQPEGESGSEVARLVDCLGQLRIHFPLAPVVAVGRVAGRWEWTLREAGASQIVAEMEQSECVFRMIRRHFDKYPMPVGNPITNTIVESLPWGSDR